MSIWSWPKYIGVNYLLDIMIFIQTCRYFSSEARSMCGQLSQEFMADIHRVATETDDESDFTKLQHYLLEGRGWKLLEIIRRIGVQVSIQLDDECGMA